MEINELAQSYLKSCKRLKCGAAINYDFSDNLNACVKDKSSGLTLH